MTPKERAAMQQALEALRNVGNTVKYLIVGNSMSQMYGEMRDKAVNEANKAITALREALAEQAALGQPVSQEYQDHLVNQSFDWAAMAAKHQFMEGYRIGLAEMREKCATVSEQGTGEAVQKTALELLLNERKRIAAAIRTIKFEGDTGFRPVSEMVAEHKQDPKKGAAIEKAKTRKVARAEKIAMPGVYEVPVEQAEQEPVAFQMICPRCKVDRVTTPCPRGGVSDCPMTATAQSAAQQPVKQEPCGFTAEQQDRFAAAFDVAFAKAGLPQKQPVKQEPVGIVHDSYDTQGIEWKCKDPLPTGTKLYAAPVRTKDLTDEDLNKLLDYWSEDERSAYGGAWRADGEYVDMKSFARAVIAADREKNK